MERLSGLLIALIVLGAVPCIALAQEESCLVYFTSTNCPNCAVTDPIVLEQWTSENDMLVIIEYMFEGWSESNAVLLGQYAQEYGTISAVPLLFIDEDSAISGRLDIPNMDIAGLSGNPCVTLDGEMCFGEIDLNVLEGEPLKLWSGERLLLRKGGQVTTNVPSDFLKEILLTKDLENVIASSSYDIREIVAEPAYISHGHAEFEKALGIGDYWVLEYNESSGSGSSHQNVTGGNVIDVPFFGRVNLSEMSLPAITVMLGLADGFNPCAFFILSFLLGTMAYARSRRRIALIGGIFVFFSGFIYFMFMAAWLNVFLLGTELFILTLAAAAVAIVAGVINVKDFFFFKKGVSLTLPTKQKERFTGRVKNLLENDSLIGLVTGTVILAVTVNMYELLCTIGFPFVYTRTLTLNSLTGFEYYMYLAFYNVMYVIPISIVVAAFAITLGSKKFGVEGVKNLKLVSGLMILFLGFVLLIDYRMLENITVTMSLLVGAVLISGAIIGAKHFMKKKNHGKQR